MIKHLLLTVCLVPFAFALCPAQAASSSSQASQDTQAKIWKVNLLSQIMPLAMKKDQYNDILLALEKARQKEQETFKVEADAIAKLAPDVDKAYDDAIEKGIYPSREVEAKIVKLNRALTIQRELIRGVITDDVFAVVDKTLDAGQKKVMANSLNPKDLDPNAKPDQMTDAQKEKLFVRAVFLDDAAYDLMVKLAAKAP